MGGFIFGKVEKFHLVTWRLNWATSLVAFKDYAWNFSNFFQNSYQQLALFFFLFFFFAFIMTHKYYFEILFYVTFVFIKEKIIYNEKESNLAQFPRLMLKCYLPWWQLYLHYAQRKEAPAVQVHKIETA